MRILAIDPGPKRSAYVLYNSETRELERIGLDNNNTVNGALWHWQERREADHLVVEMIACYGMAVGEEVFETCVWIGRFMEAWHDEDTCHRMFRREVKLHLCNSVRAKDTNVRQALIDKFGGSEAIGKKATPGPLYGVKKDIWAALAVAVTFAERN